MIRQNIWRMLDFVIVLGTAIGYLSSSSVLETVAKVDKGNFFNKLPSNLTFGLICSQAFRVFRIIRLVRTLKVMLNYSMN